MSSAVFGTGRGHAEFCAPAIDFLLVQCGITIEDIEAIAVGVGPGLFTGLRVGIITAEILADSLGLPIVGVSSLDLIAKGVGDASGAVAAIVDARRSEVFWAVYEPRNGELCRQGEMALSTPAECAKWFTALDETPVLAGNGAIEYRESFESAGLHRFAPSAAAFPTAVLLNEEAESALMRGDVEPVRPIYMRGADAKIGWQTASKEASASKASLL